MTDLKNNIITNKQVKSKKRVADHGEVFTNKREVNAMLDLVKQETERIDSRFLEPACGDGNFLAEVLKRKLVVVSGRYSKSQIEWEFYAFIAVSSIYGIDVLEDNTQECRIRLFNIFEEQYKAIFKDKCKVKNNQSIFFLLNRNILWGNALDFKNPITHEPIIFSEWCPINDYQIKRRDYKLDMLLRARNPEPNTLFSDLGDEAFIPAPVREYPPFHFLKLGEDATTEL